MNPDSRTSWHEIIALPSGNLTVEMSFTPAPASPLSKDGVKLAVLLHPWARLGGSMNDVVLQFFADFLNQRNYNVILYNSRGVGKSSGWQSFTGLQEAQDLQAIVQWGISYLTNVKQLCILGYSYGSLIASIHPTLPEPITTIHILISYPLDKRSLLTLFHSNSYILGLSTLIRDPRSHMLVAFGDRDEFTSIDSYKTWIKELKLEDSGPQNKIEFIPVEGASHFWRGSSLGVLSECIGKWLDGL